MAFPDQLLYMNVVFINNHNCVYSRIDQCVSNYILNQRIYQVRTKIFYIGLTLIIISFIFCVMSFYLLGYGVPTFLLGALLVSLSKQKIKTKVLTIVLPPVLYIPCTFLFLYIYNYSTPKTILIPINFAGNLRIVYEEGCGRAYDEKNGVKTLTFPDHGILILNEEFDGHVNYHYYLVDGLGNRTEVPQRLSFEGRVPKQPFVLVLGSGTIGQTVQANSIDKEEKGISYSDFFVYNKDTMGLNDFKTNKGLTR
jgi:hypothetical protein